MSFVLDDVCKAYPGRLTFQKISVLREVSCSVEAGRVLALIGQNGAGKTTLLKCILGFLRPDRGTITMDGRPVSALLGENGVGYMPERLERLGLTPREYAETLLTLRGLTVGDYSDRFRELAERLYLTKYLDRPMDKCSKGTVKKAIFLQAVLHRPSLVILDEPTDGLDPLARRAMLGEIRQLRDSGCTLLITTHLLSDLMLVADEAAILQNGSILRQTETKDLPGSLDDWYYDVIMENGGAEGQ